MLTAIEIENFKGVSDRVRLDIKPLTLLFGANGAGKSTFLHALQYARAALLHHNVDPSRTTSGGESVDVGGFASFVHGRDLTRAIRMKFHLSLVGNALPRIIDMDVETDSQPQLGYGPKGFAQRMDQEAKDCWVEF